MQKLSTLVARPFKDSIRWYQHPFAGLLIIQLTCHVLPAVATAVDGKLPKLGAAVTYTAVITNGARAVSASNNFTFTTNPAYDAGSLACTMLNASEPVPVVAGAALPLNLAASATITCSFRVTVTTAHQAAGAIPAVTVQPGFVDSSSGSLADLSLYVAPSSSAPVKVFSGINLSAAAAAFTTSAPSITGEAPCMRFRLDLPAKRCCFA